MLPLRKSAASRVVCAVPRLSGQGERESRKAAAFQTKRRRDSDHKNQEALMNPRADLLERKTPTGVFKICSRCRVDMRADLPRLRERFKEHVKQEHPEVVTRRRAA